MEKHSVASFEITKQYPTIKPQSLTFLSQDSTQVSWNTAATIASIFSTEYVALSGSFWLYIAFMPRYYISFSIIYGL